MSDGSVGSGLFTPGQVRELADRVNRDAQAFADAMVAYGRTERARTDTERWRPLLTRFLSWFSSWNDYYQRLIDSGWERLWGGAVDALEARQRDLVTFQRALRAFTSEVGPSLAPLPSEASPTASLMRNAGMLLLGLGGIYLLTRAK